MYPWSFQANLFMGGQCTFRTGIDFWMCLCVLEKDQHCLWNEMHVLRNNWTELSRYGKTFHNHFELCGNLGSIKSLWVGVHSGWCTEKEETKKQTQWNLKGRALHWPNLTTWFLHVVLHCPYKVCKGFFLISKWPIKCQAKQEVILCNNNFHLKSEWNEKKIR